MIEDVYRSLQRPVDPAQTEICTYLLNKAERKLARIVQLRGYDLGALCADDPRTAAYVRDVIVDAVARVLRNPAAAAGYRSESEGNYSYTLANGTDVSANVFFPNEAVDLIVKQREVRYGNMLLARRRG